MDAYEAMVQPSGAVRNWCVARNIDAAASCARTRQTRNNAQIAQSGVVCVVTGPTPLTRGPSCSDEDPGGGDAEYGDVPAVGATSHWRLLRPLSAAATALPVGGSGTASSVGAALARVLCAEL